MRLWIGLLGGWLAINVLYVVVAILRARSRRLPPGDGATDAMQERHAANPHLAD